MKKTAVFIAIGFSLLLADKIHAQEMQPRWGLGMGPLSNGLGFNYRFATEGIYHLPSLGCPGLGYSSVDGLVYRCGLAYSMLVAFDSYPHHSLGLNAGISREQRLRQKNTVLHTGLVYSYFFTDVHSGGWNLQAGPLLSYVQHSYYRGIMLGFGYQY